MFSVETQFFHCLLCTVYPSLPALDSFPLLFFSMKRGPGALFVLPKKISLQVRLLFSTWPSFWSLKRKYLQDRCLRGLQGVLCRVRKA